MHVTRTFSKTNQVIFFSTPLIPYRFAVSEALRRMYGVQHDLNSLPQMPKDGDSWSVMYSWVLPTRSFLEFVMFSRYIIWCSSIFMLV